MSKNIQSANQNQEEMLVKDFMTKNPDFVTPETTLKEAANKMSELDTGSLPVKNEQMLVGFVTDRDIAIKGVSEGKDADSAVIDEVMTHEVVSCHEDDELEDVCDEMKENEVLRMVVLDNNNRFVGVITHGQIAKAAVENKDDNLCRKVAELACYDKLAA